MVPGTTAALKFAMRGDNDPAASASLEVKLSRALETTGMGNSVSLKNLQRVRVQRPESSRTWAYGLA